MLAAPARSSGAGSDPNSPRAMSITGPTPPAAPHHPQGAGAQQQHQQGSPQAPTTPVQPPIARVPSSGFRGAQSPLAKSRLSGLSHMGGSMTLPQGKVRRRRVGD